MEEYYRKRAAEYEDIYKKPERQEALRAIRSYLKEPFSGKDVLEIACGTGYWTEELAHTAHSIIATDINDAVLDIARVKTYRGCQPVFENNDAFEISINGSFNACFAGFWFSHIKIEQYRRFFNNLHRHVVPGATIVFLDNLYVDGSSTPISRTDEHGNTYQNRHLKDGTKFEVVKNFPSEHCLTELIMPYAASLRYKDFAYYWAIEYVLGNQSFING